MKFITTVVLTILFSFLSCLYLPWWSIAIVACIIAILFPQKHLLSFLSGFIALTVLWGGLALWISSNNDHILAHRVSLLVFQSDSPFLLILVTTLIGALTGGLGALTGSFLRLRRR